MLRAGKISSRDSEDQPLSNCCMPAAYSDMEVRTIGNDGKPKMELLKDMVVDVCACTII